MQFLINQVNVCDYGDGTPGSCLVDKTNNSSADAKEHAFTRCNGCGREHDCAIILVEKLRLKDGVRFVSDMRLVPEPPPKPSGRKVGMRAPRKKIAH